MKPAYHSQNVKREIKKKTRKHSSENTGTAQLEKCLEQN
jgi:hypothetical protein